MVQGIRPLAIVIAISHSLMGCSSVATYFKHRALDLTDVIDLKYGGGWGNWGLGAKVEIFSYLGTGLGYGNERPVIEWYGRRAARYPTGFLHLLFLGAETPTGHMVPKTYGCSSAWFVQAQGFPEERFWSHALRTGPEILLPFVRFGIYFNAFEFLDFFTGLVGYDLAGDDGLSKAVDQVIEDPPDKD